MPNECMNELEITGPQADADELRRIMTTAEDTFDFTTIAPIPDQHDGYANCREWCSANWGTNRGALYSKWASPKRAAERDAAHIVFITTAWSPPIQVVAALSRRFTALTLRLSYDEPGCAFRGFVTYLHGELVAHKHEEYWM